MAPETATRCSVDLLPPELLSYIFGLICHPIRGPGLRLELPSGDDDPRLALTHVCTRWRALAIRKRSLWSLVLLSSGPGRQPSPYFLTFLQRARNVPLDVVIRLEVETEEDAGKRAKIRSYFAFLAAKVTRWRTFMFSAHENFLYIPVFGAICLGAGLTALEYLSFDVQTGNVSPGVFDPARVPSALKHVSLSGMRMDIDTDWLRGLQSLNIANPARDLEPTYHDVLRILARCPALEALSLVFTGWREDDENEDGDAPVSTVVELRELRRFELSIDEPAYVTALLGLLFIPDLRSLEIRNTVESNCLYATQPFSSALLRPYPETGCSMLKNVETFICDTDWGVQGGLLVALQNVQTLLLVREENLLSSLYPDSQPSGRTLCPKLKNIILGTSKAKLRAFVEARMEAGIPLSTVIASTDGEGLTSDEQAWFESAVPRFHVGVDLDLFDVDELEMRILGASASPQEAREPTRTHRTDVFRSSRNLGWTWHSNGLPIVGSLTS